MQIRRNSSALAMELRLSELDKMKMDVIEYNTNRYQDWQVALECTDGDDVLEITHSTTALNYAQFSFKICIICERCMS